jgi:hypothetical protein
LARNCEDNFNDAMPEEPDPPAAAEAENVSRDHDTEPDVEAEEAELVDWGYVNEEGNAIVEGEDDGDDGDCVPEDEYSEEGYTPL